MSRKIKDIFFILTISCLLNGCYNKAWAPFPEEYDVPFDQKKVVLLWNSQRYPLTNVSVLGDSVIIGTEVWFPPIESQLHVYVDSTFVLSKAFDARKFSIPLSAVDSIKVLQFEYYRGKTKLAFSVGCVVALVGSVVYLALKDLTIDINFAR